MLNSKFLKAITAFLMAVLLTAVSVISVPTSAASTSEMKSEIEELEEKSKKLEAEISSLKKDKAEQQAIANKLDEQISNTQAKIAACTRLISNYKSEIKALETEIENKQSEIEETKFLYKQRMRSIYMSGSTNNDLLILLDADSFADYLALSEVSKTVSAHDKKLVNEITDAIASIKESQKLINEKMEAQNSVKSTLASEQAKLKSQQSEVNGVISSINSDQKALEKENAAYHAAINQLEKEIQAALSSATSGGTATATNPVFTSTKFLWPVPGYYNITSYYGQRWGRLHGGIDIASAGIEGKPIVASADGVVIAAGYNTGGYGNWVMINHGTNDGKQYATVYAHMKYSPSVSNGQSVKAGQVIGYVGTTGRSTGNHCHFEIRVNGSRVNPMSYFSKAS